MEHNLKMGLQKYVLANIHFCHVSNTKRRCGARKGKHHNVLNAKIQAFIFVCSGCYGNSMLDISETEFLKVQPDQVICLENSWNRCSVKLH